MNWFSRLFARKPRYTYGRIERPDGVNKENVRLDTQSGRVQFVLWKAGEQGHSKDFWCDMGDGWESYFMPTTERKV